MKKIVSCSLATALTITFLLASMTAATAWTSMQTISPWTSGNAAFEASQILYGPYMYSYKIEGWDGVLYPHTFVVTWEGNTITVTSNDGIYFSWSATKPISAVIVKGGTAANVFYYSPPATSDTGLYAPINPKNGKPYAVSHVTFCWNPSGYRYETAFGKGAGAVCFLTQGFDRWGWTNLLPDTGTYTFDMWAGAGQCDTSKGTLVGTAQVTYAGGTVTVSFTWNAGILVTEYHVYAGTAMFPKDKNGNPTVAPGQYTVGTGLSGPIYVIVHAAVGIPA